MDAEELRLVMLMAVQPRWIEGTLPDVLRLLRFGQNWREEKESPPINIDEAEGSDGSKKYKPIFYP